MNTLFILYVFPITLAIIFFIITIISILKRNKKYDIEYFIIDTYILEKGTPIHYKSYRHATVYTGRYKHYKSINLYLLPDGRLLEVIANTLVDKELTELDKDVFVLKIEDSNRNVKLLSYDLNTFPKNHQEYLLSLQLNDKVQLKEITDNITNSTTPYSALLIKE